MSPIRFYLASRVWMMGKSKRLRLFASRHRAAPRGRQSRLGGKGHGSDLMLSTSYLGETALLAGNKRSLEQTHSFLVKRESLCSDLHSAPSHTCQALPRQFPASLLNIAPPSAWSSTGVTRCFRRRRVCARSVFSAISMFIAAFAMVEKRSAFVFSAN